MIMKYLYLNLVNYLVVALVVLVGIAYLTLLERKLLGYIQTRKGPNKVGMVGIFQPFSDAIKLFTKELMVILKSSYNLYYFCPLLMFMLMLMNWLTMGVYTNIYYMNYSILFIIIILTIMGYMVMFMGWSSNSIYSMIGAMRVVAQTLSYEVSFIMIILILMILSESYSFIDFCFWQHNLWYMVWLFPVYMVFFVSILAELNRSPMDFVEGESELVSGFNIEYFSGAFALIFLAEYGMILFFSYFISSVFTDMVFSDLLVFYVLSMVMVIIFMRGILPRMRYDELMYLCWKIILPFTLNYFIFILGMKFLFMLIF